MQKNAKFAATKPTVPVADNMYQPKLNATTIAIGVVSLAVILMLAYFTLDLSKEKKNSVAIDSTPVTSADSLSNDQQSIVNTSQLQITATTDQATAELVQKVFKHIFLPSGNVQISTVLKPEELKKINPIFYEFVKEGDKVLIYPDRAILYDPVIDKVLDVTHIGSSK
jgi:hypothetical protein